MTAGHAVAQHVKSRLPVDLVNQLLRSGAPAEALRAGFAATQAGLAPPQPGAAVVAAQCRESGCTATAVLLREAALVAAWVGNSRAVLALRQAPGPGGLAPQAVTRDHVVEACSGACRAGMLRTAGSGRQRIVRCKPCHEPRYTRGSAASARRLSTSFPPTDSSCFGHYEHAQHAWRLLRSFAPGEPLAEDMRRCQLVSGPALSRCLGCNPACKCDAAASYAVWHSSRGSLIASVQALLLAHSFPEGCGQAACAQEMDWHN